VVSVYGDLACVCPDLWISNGDHGRVIIVALALVVAWTAAANTPWAGRFRVREIRLAEDVLLAARCFGLSQQTTQFSQGGYNIQNCYYVTREDPLEIGYRPAGGSGRAQTAAITQSQVVGPDDLPEGALWRLHDSAMQDDGLGLGAMLMPGVLGHLPTGPG
jgi:hypothetical protein